MMTHQCCLRRPTKCHFTRAPGRLQKRELAMSSMLHSAMETMVPSSRRAFRERILPAVENFSPDFVLISAGFDAHHRDPLAGLNLVEDDFDWATGKLMEVAEGSCGSRVVSVLEGGYDLRGLNGLSIRTCSTFDDRIIRKSHDGRKHKN